MSEFEPGDPLWKLLGHARRPEPSDFFARRVLREVRLLAERPAGFLERLGNLMARPVFVTAALGALVVLGVVTLSRFDRAETGGLAPVGQAEEGSETFDPASELAAVEYLGQLMAVADPGQLDDASLADLFF